MKKKVALLLTAAMLTMSLAGCSSSTSTDDSGSSSEEETAEETEEEEEEAEEEAAEEEASEEEVEEETAETEEAAEEETGPESTGEVQEITWMYWDDLETTEDLITLGWAEAIDRFNEDYDGVYHVNVVTTNLEEYYTKLNALVAAGETPDVFVISAGADLDNYVNAGVTADLTDYLYGDDGWIDVFSSEALFEQMTYEDGGIYAVPVLLTAACVYYNIEMFEEVGVEVPETYTELLEVCQTLQDAGYTPITISASTAWCLSMLAGYLCDREGLDLDAVESGEISWVNDATLAAGEKLLELSQYFQSTAAGDTNEVATAAFYNSEAAILIQGSWDIAALNGNNPDFADDYGIFQFPEIEGANDPNRVIAKSSSFSMYADTEYPEACVALLKYFTDDITQAYIAEYGGSIPVTNVEYDESVAPSQLADVMEIFSNATGTLGFYNESLVSTEAGSVFDDTMVSLYLGDYTVEEAFQEIEDWYEANVRELAQ